MTSRIRNMLPARAGQDVIPLLLLVAFFSLYYFDFLFGAKIFTHGDDNTFLLAPTFAKISSLLSQGELPTHVDTSMGGLEFYNSAQFSIYYPLYPFHFIELNSGLHAASVLNLFTLSTDKMCYSRKPHKPLMSRRKVHNAAMVTIPLRIVIPVNCLD